MVLHRVCRALRYLAARLILQALRPDQLVTLRRFEELRDFLRSERPLLFDGGAHLAQRLNCERQLLLRPASKGVMVRRYALYPLAADECIGDPEVFQIVTDADRLALPLRIAHFLIPIIEVTDVTPRQG